MDKVYIVKYSIGSYDDYRVIDLFATFDKYFAEKYASKFNNILSKYKEFYRKFEDNSSLHWIKDEYSDDYFDKWYLLKETGEAFIYELNIRK